MTSRRDVLRLAALGALAGCTPSKRPAPTPSLLSPSPKPSLSQLGSSLDGSLVVPSSTSYVGAHVLFNPLFDDVQPLAVVQAASEADVARSITWARDAGVSITARSGGHSYTGKSVGTGLVVDLRRLNRVSASGGVATIGPGAMLGAIYTKLNAQGVSISGGSCPTVGISGLLMGGGYGVVAPQQGLTCDGLESARLVTPDGETLTVTSNTNADLYWLLRGGAHAPGIVTEWQITTFATQDVVIYSVSWPWAAADQVLPAWMTWIESLPMETFSTCKLLATDDHSGASKPTVGVYGLHQGPAASLTPLLAQLTSAVGTQPTSTRATPHSFAEAMQIEAGTSSAREEFVATSDFIEGAISSETVAQLIEAIEERQQDPTLIRGGSSFDRFGGAIGSVANTDTAFAHRSAQVLVQHTATLPTGASLSVQMANKASLAAMHGALRTAATGGAYPNYLSDTITHPGPAYFGNNLDRVRTTMADHDPEGRFTRLDLTGD